MQEKGFTPILIIAGIVILVGLIGGIYFLKTVKNKPTQPIPSPITSQEQVNGDIKWLDQPVKISQTGPLLVFPQTIPPTSADNMGQITALPTFYKVGEWTGGDYKGSDVIAIQYTFTGQVDYHRIKYASIKGSKAILFDTSSDEATSFIDQKAQASDLILDQKLIPGLLPTQQNGDFPVNFNGTTVNFNIYPTGEFLSESGYTFLTTFANGQKLYRKDQSNQNIPWSHLENPYQATDFDHTELRVDNRKEDPLFIAQKEDKHWIVQPDLLPDLSPDSKSLDDIGYSDIFDIGCKFTPIESLVGNSTLNTSELKLAMTANNNSYYQPTNADNLLQPMYRLIKEAEKNDTSKKAPSYQRFVNSMPVLIWKDKFSTYHLEYRWRDYPGREGGCGKPVIYLYPQSPTNISVRFTDPMALTTTNPPYLNSWKVLAKPNGLLTDLRTGQNYPNLYWEGASINTLPNKEIGFVVKRSNLDSFLNSTLTAYGLNDQERSDFIDFWLPKMQKKPFYKISFYTTGDINQAIPLAINPHPDTVFRILMKYQGLDKEISVAPQQLPQPFLRNGFTVVEWGGIFSE